MKYPKTLLQFIAEACRFAQNHIDCPDAWDTDIVSRVHLLQCTSYQVACFLAQNTVNGGEGVDWDVALEPLVEWPQKSTEAWLTIIENLANDYGGWK